MHLEALNVFGLKESENFIQFFFGRWLFLKES